MQLGQTELAEFDGRSTYVFRCSIVSLTPQVGADSSADATQSLQHSLPGLFSEIRSGRGYSCIWPEPGCLPRRGRSCSMRSRRPDARSRCAKAFQDETSNHGRLGQRLGATPWKVAGGRRPRRKGRVHIIFICATCGCRLRYGAYVTCRPLVGDLQEKARDGKNWKDKRRTGNFFRRF